MFNSGQTIFVAGLETGESFESVAMRLAQTLRACGSGVGAGACPELKAMAPTGARLSRCRLPCGRSASSERSRPFAMLTDSALSHVSMRAIRMRPSASARRISRAARALTTSDLSVQSIRVTSIVPRNSIRDIRLRSASIHGHRTQHLLSLMPTAAVSEPPAFGPGACRLLACFETCSALIK